MQRIRFTSMLVRIVSVASATILFASAATAGPKAYVGNFKDDTVSVIDIAAGKVVATIPVSAGPHGMASSRDGRRVFISGDGSSNVDVIDVASDRVVGTIAVGKSPHGLAMAPDGKVALVGVYGDDKVAFIDTTSDRVTGSVDVAKPHTIAIAPDGRVAYVASQAPGAFALVVVDLATRTVARRIALDKPPRDLEFGYDGKALYFTQGGIDAVQVLDPVTDRVVAQIPTGASPHIASVFRGAPAGTVVVQGPGEVMLFDPATQKSLRSLAVGKQPHWIAWAGMGSTVVVTNEGSNDVALVDLQNGQTVRVPVGTAPRKVTVPVAAADAGKSAANPTAKVSIAKFAFGPADLRVAAGEAVTWSNDDGAPHGVSFADGTKGEDLMLPSATFTRVFMKPGDYAYVCPIHPFMTGHVFVGAR